MALASLIHDPALARFQTTFPAGSTIFLEGDDDRDLFILQEGRLEVLKGRKRIAAISEPGAVFGEMAFLAGEKRSATVRAANTVTALRIPGDQVEELVAKVPGLGLELARTLAVRLRRTTSMAHGFKEFCDQLPDAVMIATDAQQRITVWNRAAEELYGRSAAAMEGLTLADLYQDPADYQALSQRIAEGESGDCAVGRVQLPDGSLRYIASSVTPLVDGHGMVQGVLFLARDVTRVKEMEARYHRIRTWFVPALVLLVLATGFLAWAWPTLYRGNRILAHKEAAFRNQVRQVFNDVDQRLAATVAGEEGATLAAYLAARDLHRYGITGLFLLDGHQRLTAQAPPVTAGTTTANYAGLGLPTGSATNLLHLYRPTAAHPLGEESWELVRQRQAGGGWLGLRLDPTELAEEFGITTGRLKKLQFSE